MRKRMFILLGLGVSALVLAAVAVAGSVTATATVTGAGSLSLSHGATASVFEGIHTGLGKRVALKVIGGSHGQSGQPRWQ